MVLKYTHSINWRMNLYNFDASAVIDLWDNYPIQNPVFKDLWDKFTENVENEIFVISDIAIKEVTSEIVYEKITKDMPRSVDFIKILSTISVFEKEPIDLTTAQDIKDLLEIDEDNYHKNGVGENDVLIIAITRRTQAILVSNESRQPNLPIDKSRYKIPAVCNLPEVKIRNINLTELLRQPNLW